jgi:hypothetical protein
MTYLHANGSIDLDVCTGHGEKRCNLIDPFLGEAQVMHQLKKEGSTDRVKGLRYVHLEQ